MDSERLTGAVKPSTAQSRPRAPSAPWGGRLGSPVERISQGSAWVVLAIALLVSFFAWVWAARQASESLAVTMKAASKEMAQSISTQVGTLELVLRGAAGLFRGEESPDRERWAAYSAHLAMSTNLPGIQALSYAVRLQADERAAHERSVRADGFAQYSIAPPGDRPEVAPVVYIEPLEGSNLRAFGFDMLTDRARRAAVLAAAAGGTASLTEPIRLLQQSDARNDRGVLIVYPVYVDGMPLRTDAERSAAVRGWLIGTIVMRDFLRVALVADPAQLGITLFDVAPDGTRTVLFRPALGGDEEVRNPVDLRFEIADRTWLLQLDPAAFATDRARLQTTPMLVLTFGLVASLLLFTLVWSMATTRDRALAIARDITRQLTAVNNELESRVAARTSLLQRVNERLERQISKRRSAERARREVLKRERALNARLQAISEFAAEMTVPEPVDDKLRTLSAAARELLEGVAARVRYASAEDGMVHEGGDGREEWWLAGEQDREVARIEAVILDADGIQRGRIVVMRREDRPFSPDDELVLAHFALLAAAALSVRESFESQLLARRQAEQSSRIKDQLLSVVSHELRTPLAAMKGWVHVLGQPARDPSDAARRQAVEALGRSVDAQRAMVEDLIDTASLIAGTFELETSEVDLGELMRDARTRAGPSAMAKRVALTVRGDAAIGNIEADPVRLGQVLDHLLENAIKFTPDGGSIHMHAIAQEDKVRVEVVDSGEGIDADSLPHLFERFWMADPSITRRVGGLGVGLSLVRAIIEAHGGEVRAESDGRGRGARLVITLRRRLRGDERSPGPQPDDESQ